MLYAVTGIERDQDIAYKEFSLFPVLHHSSVFFHDLPYIFRSQSVQRPVFFRRLKSGIFCQNRRRHRVFHTDAHIISLAENSDGDFLFPGASGSFAGVVQKISHQYADITLGQMQLRAAHLCRTADTFLLRERKLRIQNRVQRIVSRKQHGSVRILRLLRKFSYVIADFFILLLFCQQIDADEMIFQIVAYRPDLLVQPPDFFHPLFFHRHTADSAARNPAGCG